MNFLLSKLILIKIIILKKIKTIIQFVKNETKIIFAIISICFFSRQFKAFNVEYGLLYDQYPDLGQISKKTGFRNNLQEYDLSIIIPLYNVGEYIAVCLESILFQESSFSFEMILVDDGSTDDTIRRVEGYLSDFRISLIKQVNAGQSSARNNGIYHSRGKYLMFVDADDILLPNAIESLMNAAVSTNSDIAEGCVVRFYDSITDEMINDSIGKNRIESNKNNPRFVLTTYGYSVAKVYKRELWTTLRYPEGYIFEDVISKFILRRKANQVAFIEDVVYGYRMNNPNSTSHGTNKMKKLDSIWVLPKVFDLCEQEQAPRDDVFYLLSLNHIGLLNYITTRAHDMDVRLACFAEMRKQLTSIQDCRPKHMPLMFKLLDRAILENKFDAWEYIAGTINKYGMLKKWREIN